MERVYLWILIFSALFPQQAITQPCDPISFLNKSEKLLQAGDFQGALQQTDLGLQCDSTYAGLLLIRYMAFRNLHQERSALETAKKAKNTLEAKGDNRYQFEILSALTESGLLRRDSLNGLKYWQELQDWMLRITVLAVTVTPWSLRKMVIGKGLERLP